MKQLRPDTSQSRSQYAPWKHAAMTWFVRLWIVGILFALAIVSGGCGDVTKMTDRQIDKDVEVKAKYIDMFSELAQKHGFSYVIKFEIGGEPRVSQELSFKLDTDVSLEMIAHGNAAAGRKPDSPP